MSFDRARLPDPSSYFESEGLKLTGRGKWRTTECRFHGGSDSMRINVQSGGFLCMAGCGAKGGDALAYRMAAHGEDFVTAARALGAWIEDGKPTPKRPTSIAPRDAISLIANECNLVAVAAANLAHGVALTSIDLERLLKAAGRITRVVEVFV